MVNPVGDATRRLLLLLALSAVVSSAAADELCLDAKTLFERSVTREIRLAADGSAVELQEGELFEDDGPAAEYSFQPNEERITDQVWVRKELVVANAIARNATLLIGPGGRGLKVAIIECMKVGGQKNLIADEYRQAATSLLKAGADGVYLFNFFTSREEGEKAYEPPFEVEVLRDLVSTNAGSGRRDKVMNQRCPVGMTFKIRGSQS